MTTLTISLPDSLKAFVEEQAAKEGFGTASDYLRVVLEQVQRRRVKEELEAKLQEGARSSVIRRTPRHWEELEGPFIQH